MQNNLGAQQYRTVKLTAWKLVNI
uniref:Uncharacterized protein n=1 Tax=Anguilla anguilla TaxID=7936 RepID=A0A0E9SX19_ANGAN